MKKILITIMLLLITGCSNSGLVSSEKEVYNMYENAVKNLSELDSYKLDSNITLAFASDSNIKDVNINSMFEVNNAETTDFYYRLGRGEGINIGLYYKDGTVYTSIVNAKVQATLPKILMSVDNLNMINKINKKGMVTGTKEETANGTKITLQFSADSVEKIVSKIKFDIDGIGKIENAETGVVDVVMNIDKNGALIDQKVSFVAMCNVISESGSKKVELKYDATEVVSGVNSTNIDFPEDLENYASFSIDKIKEFLTEYGII